MEGYVQSATEDGLAPEGKHTMSLLCQYAPYDLDGGTWGEQWAGIGANIVETFAEYAPNLPEAIEHIEVLGPPNIEARVGITGGNIFHGEILPERKFGNRPVPSYSGYRTPVENLYLCGDGAWSGGLRRARTQLRTRGPRGPVGAAGGHLSRRFTTRTERSKGADGDQAHKELYRRGARGPR